VARQSVGAIIGGALAAGINGRAICESSIASLKQSLQCDERVVAHGAGDGVKRGLADGDPNHVEEYGARLRWSPVTANRRASYVAMRPARSAASGPLR
jgi:hypothetical protein